MGLETSTYIDGLVTTNPTATDVMSKGDDHIRLIKATIKSSFPDVDAAVMTIHNGTSAPASKQTGTIWRDTSNSLWKFWNGSTWITLAIAFNTSNSVDVNAGTIDGVTIGGSAAPTVTNLGSVATCDLNGGTLDGMTIGASVAPTVTNIDINGGSVDGITIGTNSACTDLRVDNIKVDGNTISSTDSNGDVTITPNGTGDVVLDGIKYPQSDGSANQVIVTNGSAQLSFTGDIVEKDASPALGGNLDVGTSSIVSASNRDIAITPNGSGDLILDGVKWPQADGSSTNYLTTNGSGQASWTTNTVTTSEANALTYKNAAETAKVAAETAKTASETAKTAAETAKTAAETALDNFDDRFLGAKSTSGGDPTVDNDGDALVDGSMFFDTTNNYMKVYDLGNTTWYQLTNTTSNQNNINTVAGQISPTNNISAVAGKATQIGLLGDSAVIADMALLGDSGVIADMNLLGTSAVVGDMDLLGTSANVTAMGLLGTSANVTAMSNCSGSIASINTVSSNISSVNNFSSVYRIDSSDPSSSLTEGDLVFRTDTDTMRVYNGSAWQDVAPTSSANIFGTVAVSGQSSVVADSTTDTLTLVASGGTTITTNAGTDTITIDTPTAGASTGLAIAMSVAL